MNPATGLIGRRISRHIESTDTTTIGTVATPSAAWSEANGYVFLVLLDDGTFDEWCAAPAANSNVAVRLLPADDAPTPSDAEERLAKVREALANIGAPEAVALSAATKHDARIYTVIHALEEAAAHLYSVRQ